ncbi:MAG: L-alanine-DL-glutamate epimerase [Spirochaetes bacterium]|nr:L-alanine-DL-glutamate epimerase [Spirochaetota bacterium]
MKIKNAQCDFKREPLLAPFGFKGGYLSELWQARVSLEDEGGLRASGLGTQSVLWSDGAVFTGNPEAAGNAMMFLITSRAAQMAKEVPWETPLDLQAKILPELVAYGKTVTGRPDLRLTFILNALVALDNAAWVLYARRLGVGGFDAMVPEPYRKALGARHGALALVPLLSYGVKAEGIRAVLEAGHPLLKIKIGSDPEGDGDPEKMLAWDQARLAEIHQIARGFETPHTASGRIAYYLDANGRYPSTDFLARFLDHAKALGALGDILILEEPFAEENHQRVGDLGVRVAADESAHGEADVRERIDLGYRALALKPIAKTLSMTLRMLAVAAEKGIPCFCADLTVNPILVEWNKNVAARLPLFPGMKAGIVETNGFQNYRDWDAMAARHPCAGKSWTKPQRGIFALDADFYAQSGGILLDEKQ